MDLFDIDRQRRSNPNRPKQRLEEDRQRMREREAKFIKLKPGYYFDPVDRVILRKSGFQYYYIQADRRRRPRVKAEDAQEGQFRLIVGGLFWDPKTMAIYKPQGSGYVLYSKDRRKAPSDRRRRAGSSPTGEERRKRQRRGVNRSR